MRSGLSVLVTPRDSVPYQELLYRNVVKSNVRVQYADGLTPSQSLNVILSPLLLVWWRLRGYRILHIHWLFQFSLPWARRQTWARRLMEFWFTFYIRLARLIGYDIVWTAHDLLPHEPVFADDVRARATLLTNAALVIALSEATAGQLREIGADNVIVIPHGPYASPYPITQSVDEARADLGFDSEDVVVTLIGKIEEYKGADLLLRAAARLPTSSRIKVVLVGACTDNSYRSELDRLAREAGSRVILLFERIPEEDVARYIQASNFAVFPFREVTNSGSVILAQSFGLPVMIADLPSLSDIPSASAIRFRNAVDSLVEALLRAENLSESEYRSMANAGLVWATRIDWEEIAQATVKAYRRI